MANTSFKSFLLDGTFMNMAAGILVGAALSDVFTSVVDSGVVPVVKRFTGLNRDEKWVIPLGDEKDPDIDIGDIFGKVGKLVLVAGAVYLGIKIVQKWGS